MKLASLFLSSAAVLVAGSAFAADLPAKKAAPAAAVVACPAHGAGFFQLPGSDTCIQLSGYVRYDATYETDVTDTATNAKYSQAGGYRLNLDARSNTEIGVVRGFGRLSNGALGKAYVQFAGISAGMQDSLADIAGTSADQFGAGWGQAGTGITYTAALGTSSIAVGLENANNNNVGGSTYVSDRPDALLAFTTSAGPVGAKLTAVSHEATDSADGVGTTNGYALLAQLTASAGDVGVILFGGMSEAAGKYTGSPSALDDLVGTSKLSGRSVGAEINSKVGSKGLVAVAAVRNTHEQGTSETTDNIMSVFYQHTIATNLTVRPEFLISQSTTDDVDTDTSTVYLRINRDF